MRVSRHLCLMLMLALGASLGTPVRAQDSIPPYEPQLLRLAEIMGALTWLRDLCGAQDGASWRARMDQMLEAEHPAPERRERLAGAFNRGLMDYQRMHRRCTDHSRASVQRFLDEGQRLTREMSGRFGS